MARSRQHRPIGVQYTGSDVVATGPSRFTAQLYLADMGCIESMRPIRVVMKPFAFGLAGPDDADRIIVPRGFCSDGASVPQFLWGLLGNWGTFAQAAIVHDLIYATHLLDRAAADRVFRDGIRAIGANVDTDRAKRPGKLAADLAYWGVRIGGWFAYRRGKDNYARRAWRAKLRAEKLDRALAAAIITDWRDLVDAQTIDEDMIARLTGLDWRGWLFRKND